MRVLMLAAALFAAACADVEAPAPPAVDSDGYTLEIRASDAEQIYLVTAPDGRVVAGRAADGASALMADADIRALAPAVSAEPDETLRHVMSLRLPGFDLSVHGEDDGDDGGGRVELNVGGRAVQITAEDGAPGEDRAHVLIRGVPEAEVREFVASADHLSPAVQAQMLAELGLE